MFVGVFQVSGQGEYAQGAVDGYGEVVELAAEVFDVELAHAVQSVAHGHLVVVLQVFVDLADVVRVGEGVGDAVFQCCLVLGVVEDDGVGFLSVASGPSGFLEVGFDGVGQVDVYDEADVWLVDAHAEGVGGDHDAAFARLPAVLAQVFGGVVQSGVVVVGGDALGGQQFGHVLGAAPAACVDDGAALDAVQDVEQFLGFVCRAADDVGQVLPFEAHAEDVGAGEAEFLLYVVHHLGGGGGCQCQHGHAGQQGAHFGTLQVGGAEVVAPL